MNYTLICEKDVHEFDYAVSMHLYSGWKLKGETFTARRSEYDVNFNVPMQYDVFCQAMVKYDKGEKEE